MIILMRPDATEKQLQAVLARVALLGRDPHVSSPGVQKIISTDALDPELLKSFEGIEQVFPLPVELPRPLPLMA